MTRDELHNVSKEQNNQPGGIKPAAAKTTGNGAAVPHPQAPQPPFMRPPAPRPSFAPPVLPKAPVAARPPAAKEPDKDPTEK